MWNNEIYKALVEIVQAGGFYAIMGVFIWGLMPIIKISVILGATLLGIIKLTRSISNLYLLRIYNKGKQVSLLSKTTSKHLEDAITSWRKESERVTQELLKSVEDLRKNSEKTEQATTAVKNSSINSEEKAKAS